MIPDQINLGLPPDFVMKLGRIELFHNAQIKLFYGKDRRAQTISVTQRSFQVLAKEIVEIVKGKLDGLNPKEYALDKSTVEFIFERSQPVIRVKYCFHKQLSDKSRNALGREFKRIFTDNSKNTN